MSLQVGGCKLTLSFENILELKVYFDIPDIPVIPVSISDLENHEIDLSENEATDPAKQYHWLSWQCQ